MHPWLLTLAPPTAAALAIAASAAAGENYGYGLSTSRAPMLDVRPYLGATPEPQAANEPAQLTSLHFGDAGPGYLIQLGAFSSLSAAQAVRERAISIGVATIEPLTRNGLMLFRVRVGPYSSPAAAEQALQVARSHGFRDGIIARIPE